MTFELKFLKSKMSINSEQTDILNPEETDITNPEETNRSKQFEQVRFAEINESINHYKNLIEDLQNQLSELENQSVPNDQTIFDKEINELSKLIDNPEYEYEVQEKEEITNNLNYFKEEYKSIIKEIQDALKIIRK